MLHVHPQCMGIMHHKLAQKKRDLVMWDRLTFKQKLSWMVGRYEWLLHWTDSLRRVLLQLHRQSWSYSTVPSIQEADQQIFSTRAKHLASKYIYLYLTHTHLGHQLPRPSLLQNLILPCMPPTWKYVHVSRSELPRLLRKTVDRRTRTHTHSNNPRCACAQARVEGDSNTVKAESIAL